MDTFLLFLRFLEFFRPTCYPLYKSMYAPRPISENDSENNGNNPGNNNNNPSNNGNNPQQPAQSNNSNSISESTSDSDPDTSTSENDSNTTNSENESVALVPPKRFENRFGATGYIIPPQVWDSFWDSFEKNNIFLKKHDRKFCSYCKQNGEPESKYRNHNMMDRFQKCTCPLLQMVICPVCKATGQEAHTIQYCPYMNITMLKFYKVFDMNTQKSPSKIE